MDRDEAVKRIRAGLKRRTGRVWSVTGSRGSAWGWITISVPPAARVDSHGKPDKDGYMSPADCAALAKALGLSKPVHLQGESIPASAAYRAEYVDRAEGRSPRVIGTPYWD